MKECSQYNIRNKMRERSFQPEIDPCNLEYYVVDGERPGPAEGVLSRGKEGDRYSQHVAEHKFDDLVSELVYSLLVVIMELCHIFPNHDTDFDCSNTGFHHFSQSALIFSKEQGHCLTL